MPVRVDEARHHDVPVASIVVAEAPILSRIMVMRVPPRSVIGLFELTNRGSSDSTQSLSGSVVPARGFLLPGHPPVPAQP
jgi:hypothetical protein